jgi:hypothetical protein
LFANNKVVALGVSDMMLSATFNNISVISWRSMLFGEDIGVPGGGCCGRDNTGAAFRTTYAISSYHYTVLSLNPSHAKCTRYYSIL